MRHFIFLLLVFTAPQIRAQENRYDAFSKTIMPFLGVIAKDGKSGNRAFTLKVRIEQSSDLPAELNGASAEIAVQMPDKLRLHGPLLGGTFTLVREDEKIWIAPGAKARALLDAAVAGKELPPAEKKFKLSEFELPFPEKQLVFLAALFTIKDLGSEMLDGVECRVMDVSLMPELAESIKAAGWTGRLWIRPDHTPARLTLAKKGWHIVLRFDDVKFAAELPDGTWEPSSAEAADVLRLEPKEYSRFLRAIGGGE
ncbi:MAG: hypothetical protein ABMA13_06465 [Chthoniobacteraceae bacterium]